MNVPIRILRAMCRHLSCGRWLNPPECFVERGRMLPEHSEPTSSRCCNRSTSSRNGRRGDGSSKRTRRFDIPYCGASASRRTRRACPSPGRCGGRRATGGARRGGRRRYLLHLSCLCPKDGARGRFKHDLPRRRNSKNLVYSNCAIVHILTSRKPAPRRRRLGGRIFAFASGIGFTHSPAAAMVSRGHGARLARLAIGAQFAF